MVLFAIDMYILIIHVGTIDWGESECSPLDPNQRSDILQSCLGTTRPL